MDFIFYNNKKYEILTQPHKITQPQCYYVATAIVENDDKSSPYKKRVIIWWNGSNDIKNLKDPLKIIEAGDVIPVKIADKQLYMPVFDPEKL